MHTGARIQRFRAEAPVSRPLPPPPDQAQLPKCVLGFAFTVRRRLGWRRLYLREGRGHRQLPRRRTAVLCQELQEGKKGTRGKNYTHRGFPEPCVLWGRDSVGSMENGIFQAAVSHTLQNSHPR